MKNIRVLLLSTLSFALISTPVYLSGCKETKEVEITEEINEDEVETRTPVDDKKVDVNVHVEQQTPNATVAERSTETTTVHVDKTGIDNDMAAVNANLQNLQNQLKTANQQAKADLNAKIQQLNNDKIQLNKRLAELEAKNRAAENMAVKNQRDSATAKANMETAKKNMEEARNQYVELTEDKLETFTKKMDDLREKVNFLESTERPQVETQVKNIEDKQEDIQKRIDDLETANVETWKTSKNEIDKMYSDMEKTYRQLIATRMSLR